MRERPILHRLAQVSALGFALAVTAHLVVSAQRHASTPALGAPAEHAPAPADAGAAPTANATQVAPAAADPVFLSTSKSAQIQLFDEGEKAPGKEVEEVFLLSTSKSIAPVAVMPSADPPPGFVGPPSQSP
ncbi:MAG: hypothetical protein AAF682_11530 [Planctomycetota bacterium]